MPGSNSRPNVSEGYEVPLSYRSDRAITSTLVNRQLTIIHRRMFLPRLNTFCRKFQRTQCVWSSHMQSMDQPCKVCCQSCSLSAEQGKYIFPCPRLRLRIWFRKTGSTVPSRVSLLILHTQGESGAYSRNPSRFSRWWRPFILSTIRHRVSPEFIGSRNCVPMVVFTAESPSAQGQ